MDGKNKNSSKDDTSHVNHAFVCEEGKVNGGPDTRSATSTSSRGSARSSMKFLKTKLTTERRTRWIALAVIAIVTVVLILSITLAVVLSTADGDELSLSNPTADKSKGVNTSGTTISTSSSATTDPRFVSTSSDPSTKQKTTTTSGSTTTMPVVEDKTTPSNLSVSFSNVLYNPTDTDYLSLICVGAHKGDWNSLTIRRQFKDSYEPVAVISNIENESPSVNVFYPNMTFYKIVFNYEVTLSVTFEVFTCGDLTNFSCAIDTSTQVVTTHADVNIYMSEPEIVLPHAIVEDHLINISCSSDVWGSDGTLSWKIKPSGAIDYMDFSVKPYVEETQNNCTKSINSTLTLSPSMYENGSDFKCVINTSWNNSQIIQKKEVNTTMFVVPSNFCDDNREFTIHPHPYGECTLVVYCLNSGPLVYEIECEKGHCYDSKRTACVPQTS